MNTINLQRAFGTGLILLAVVCTNLHAQPAQPSKKAAKMTETKDRSTKTPATYDRAADDHGFTIFMHDGGWCWYQGPRAIIHDDKVFVGSVQGHGEGSALIGVYDLETNKQVGNVTVHEQFDRDDHNSPVFHVREDGKVLTVYAKHHREPHHYLRTVDPKHPLNWTEENIQAYDFENPRDRVTYMNLHRLSDEGKLYNFFRGIDFNPTFVVSEDGGDTWSDPVHLVRSEVAGRHRPYPNYASNGKDTVHISSTDAHPRQFGNSLYHFVFREGQFFKADGTRIKSLADDGPIKPSEMEMIYEGSMTTQKPEGFESVPDAAWTSDIAVDEQGHPHIGYTLYLSNDDHRYRLASWDGQKWIDREVAYAGKCLYTRESSYTGLIALDPTDPQFVVISTDVDPKTGKDLGGFHEIYRAHIGPEDDITTIDWQPVTANSPERNLRPKILRDGDRRVILWLRGDFRTFVNYQMDVVGLVEEAK